jgi:hypothetical protein
MAGAVGSRRRSLASIGCLVLAALLTTPAAIGYWGQRTVNDTARYVATVRPLADSPEVQEAIAAKVTSVIQQQVDAEAIFNRAFAEVVPDAPRLRELIGPLSLAVDALIERQVEQFIASDAFGEFWVAANTDSQRLLLRLLRGEDTGRVSLRSDQLVLDVSEVIDQVRELLIERGLTVGEAVAVPDSQRQIVLLEAPQVREVRTIYAFGNPIARWLILVVIGLYAVGLLLARRRPRSTVAIGVALVVNGLLIALMLSAGRGIFVEELSGTVFSRASSVFFDTLVAYLRRGQQVMAGLGLTLMVVGWSAGSSTAAGSVRRAVTKSLEGLGGALDGGGTHRVSGWVVRHLREVRIAIGLVAFAVLTWGNNLSLARLVWSLVVVAVLLALVQVLVGASRTAPTPAPGSTG